MGQASVNAIVEYVGAINGSAKQAGQPNFLPGLVNELELDSILQIVENNYSEHILAALKPVEQRPSDAEAWARFEAAATAAGHVIPKKTEAEVAELARKRERMARETFEKGVRRDMALTAARFGRMKIEGGRRRGRQLGWHCVWTTDGGTRWPKADSTGK